MGGGAVKQILEREQLASVFWGKIKNQACKKRRKKTV